MTRPRRSACLLTAAMLVWATGDLVVRADSPRQLFDGQTFQGWNGDTAGTWRIEDGALVAGTPGAPCPRNEFLATDAEFENFDLALEYRLDCTKGCNAGVQFRSRRVPDHHEVSGYQADIGPGITGALYDESRRNRFLLTPPEALQDQASRGAREGWNTYRIRCEGRRCRLWLNRLEMLDYTEPDPSIPLRGMVALQIHGGLVGTIRYRNLQIQELTTADANASSPPR